MSFSSSSTQPKGSLNFNYYDKVEEPLQVSITVSQLLEQKEKNQIKERELREKRAKLKAFQGLPPNLELARHELRAARQKQMELIQLRERLLGRMADGVA